jgi:two-component system, NarL family, sensor histidine kinase ComP
MLLPGYFLFFLSVNDVSGVCMINDNIPTILHKTGVFLRFNDTELLTYVHQRCHPKNEY